MQGVERGVQQPFYLASFEEVYSRGEQNVSQVINNQVDFLISLEYQISQIQNTIDSRAF